MESANTNTIDEFYARPDQDLPVYRSPSLIGGDSSEENGATENHAKWDVNLNKSESQSYDNKFTVEYTAMEACKTDWNTSPMIEMESNYIKEQTVKTPIKVNDLDMQIGDDMAFGASCCGFTTLDKIARLKQRKTSRLPKHSKQISGCDELPMNFDFGEDLYEIPNNFRDVYDRFQNTEKLPHNFGSSKLLQEHIPIFTEERTRQNDAHRNTRCVGGINFEQIRRRIDQMAAGLIAMVVYFMILYIGLIFIVIVTNRPMVFKPFF